MKARLCFAALSCLSLPLLTAQAEVRKWTNKAGASIEAEMTGVNVAERTISLKRVDGKEFTFPIDTLSDADRTYASEQWKKMQAAPAAAPAAGTPPAAPAAPAAPATPGAPAAPGTPPATPPAAPAAPAAAAASKKPAPPRPTLVITPAAKFKEPNANDYIKGVTKVRPRLIHAAAGWNYLKATVGSDSVAAKMLENLKASGEKLLTVPELTRIFGEQTGASTPGSQAIYRMGLLGTLNFMDPSNPGWKERGVREMIALTDTATFQNWYPDEPHVTADFLVATAIGYDWFRDGFSVQQATAARTYMVEKGIGALVAVLKGAEIPESAKGKASGSAASPKAKAPAKPAKKEDKDLPPDEEHMAAAAALILAGISLMDEEPAAAKEALDAGAKVFGKGITGFAPAGIWPEGMEAGDKVMDYAIMVMQTLRSNAGTDYGMSLVEGLPQAGLARLHLVGTSGQLFNYGDANATTLARKWVSTWLAGVHGNMGMPAQTAGAPQPENSIYFGLTGHFLYYNPHAAGDGTADSMDYGFTGGPAVAVRSAWDNKGYYLAVKGGDNSIPTAQLDLGSFVLDAGGQRWGIELGQETDRAPGFKPAEDRTKRYELYVEGTPGQNTLQMGGNQEYDAKAPTLLTYTSPAMGFGVVDLTKAYPKQVKDLHRGAMVVRGTAPYLILQDDLTMKNTTGFTWTMHTRSEISINGNKAVLKQGGQTLTATILSPANATFTMGEPPEPKTEQMKKLTGIHVLKIGVAETKGAVSVAVQFALGETPPPATVKPIAEWTPKK